MAASVTGPRGVVVEGSAEELGGGLPKLVELFGQQVEGDAVGAVALTVPEGDERDRRADPLAAIRTRDAVEPPMALEHDLAVVGDGLLGDLPPEHREEILEPRQEQRDQLSRLVLVGDEGVHVGAEAVLGANVVLTASTPIVDVTGPQEIVTKGSVPPRAVVIPGTRPKKFPAGEYHTPCALIIGERKESTDKKTSLNQVLREFAVAV